MSQVKLVILPKNYGHMCYILQSISNPNKVYIGYTVDISHRIRQHNGEIGGGAKKTTKNRPWRIICVISGFYENSSALRFEFRLQKMSVRKSLDKTLFELQKLINNGDGSIEKNNKIPWVPLLITWYNFNHIIENVYNIQITN